MSDIMELTFDQIKLYGEAIARKEERIFKSNVASSLYGAQCNPEEVLNMLKE